MKRLFLLALTLFTFNIQFAFAEITNPYTVDEKSQVLFGDSVEIAATSTSGQAVTYNGLENYATNYVNNYLHITFTYTHHRCCYAAYPPRLYVTGNDPRATTSPSLKSQLVLYQLNAVPVPPGHETDWYTYDIQFDGTGYTAVVKEAGETEVANFHLEIAGLADSDWVALANGYPIDGSTDGSITPHSMSFTPIPVYEAPVVPVATTTPVIIVPGIMGTELLEDNVVDSLIWPNTIQIVTSITDDFLDVLKMNESGLSISESIITGEIIRILNDSDYFEGLFSQLISDGYEEDNDVFEYPYDWRLDIESSATKLKERIDEIKAERGVTKVDLVAHSMGGLLVKRYLKDYGGDSIDKFIDIGTPHTGSPSAYKILMYGDNLGVSKLFNLININSDRIKEISQNMPAVYQLLPSQNYFNDAEYYVADMTSGTNRLNFSSTKDYLGSQGRNSVLVDRADEFHQEIDNLNPADYGVETYNFVGCGTPTIGQFYILDNTNGHYIYNIKMVNGDGTVPLKSAEALTATKTYYVKNVKHAVMSSASGVKELIADILTATTTDDFNISPYSNLSLNSSGCTIPNGRIVSFHSPVELHIYDNSGNHTGPDSNGDIENEIDGVVYEVIGDNKFAYLPDGVEYTIKGNATSNGTFDTRIQEVVNGEVATTTLWTDVALTSTTQVQFSVNSNTPTQITLDNDNDGVYEQPLNISTTSTGILESTGKTSTSNLQASNSSASSGSSRPADVSLNQPQVLGATSTSEALIPALISTTSTGSIKTNLQKAISTIESDLPNKAKEAVEAGEAEYKDTAIVHKSFTGKLKSVFKGLWVWIKSKL